MHRFPAAASSSSMLVRLHTFLTVVESGSLHRAAATRPVHELYSRLRVIRFASAALLVWLATIPMVPPARADDVTTLSGVTYRAVRAVRVEPDGVTWEHATGVCKVDFTDLPEAVRNAYHYDAKKAAAYQSAQAAARQQADERAQQTRREADTRRTRLFQQQATAFAAANGDAADSFIFRRDAFDLTAERSVGAQIESKRIEHDWLTRGDGTLWDRRLWAVPMMIFGSSSVDISEHPVIDPANMVFRASLHHAPGGFAPYSGNDGFFQPDYMTRAYNADVERAEAFARGRP